MLMVEGVMSALESTYALEVEAAHGLPSGERQAPVVVDGTVLFEDILYSAPGGELIVRLDGWRFHSDRRVAHRDRRRGNAAELAGRARLAYGPEEVEGEPCRHRARGRRGADRAGPAPRGFALVRDVGRL